MGAGGSGVAAPRLCDSASRLVASWPRACSAGSYLEAPPRLKRRCVTPDSTDSSNTPRDHHLGPSTNPRSPIIPITPRINQYTRILVMYPNRMRLCPFAILRKALLARMAPLPPKSGVQYLGAAVSANAGANNQTRRVKYVFYRYVALLSLATRVVLIHSPRAQTRAPIVPARTVWGLD